MIHSHNWPQLHRFAESWKGSVPLVAIPTAFPEVSVHEMQEAGIRIVIFANQALRAAARSMQAVLSELNRELRGCAVEGRIASLEEMEDLVKLRTWIASHGSPVNSVA